MSSGIFYFYIIFVTNLKKKKNYTEKQIIKWKHIFEGALFINSKILLHLLSYLILTLN